jgi:PAS domain S-box-containing protein
MMTLRSRRVRAMRRAENELRSSELRFSALSEHSLLGVYVIEDGHYTYVNEAAATILGVSRKELIGATPELWVHPQDLPIILEQIRLREEGTISSTIYECRALRKDGAIRYLRIFGGAVTIDGKRVLIGNIADITDQRNAEEALRQSETRYRSIVETSIVGICSVDDDYRFTYLNRTMAGMLGYSPGELLGRSPSELIPAEDRGVYESRVADRKRGMSSVFEHRMVHKDGSCRDVLVSAVPIVDAEGRFRGSFGVFFDITEHNAATRQVRRLAAAMDQLSEAILITDARGTIVHVNPAFEQMTGYTVADAIARHWSVRKSPLVDPTVYRAMWRTVVRGGTWEGDLKSVRKDGTVFEAHATISPVRSANGTIINYVMVARDVTSEREAEASLQDAHTQLRALSKRLVELQEEERKHIARELHDEVGQSLTATKIRLQGLLHSEHDPRFDAQLAQCVELIDTSLAQLRSLTRGLRPPLLDELGLIAALRALTTQNGRMNGMTVHFGHNDVDRRLPEEIEIACYRVAQESLTNIIKHAHATEASVDLEQTPDGLTLRIRDNGNGFDVAAARKRAVSGASMGLTGMTERVSILGGTIEWRTVPEGGTEVIANFPLDRTGTP